MSDNYIIEIRPNAAGITVQAGIVVRDGRGFRFFAATHAFNPLEGHLFRSPKEAEKAALRHVAEVSARKPICAVEARPDAASQVAQITEGP
jgi:hypothetical protein